MTVAQLISRLQAYDPNSQVMIRDGFNGGGEPREINLGPTTQKITQANADDGADCECIVGQIVVVMGYGCY